MASTNESEWGADGVAKLMVGGIVIPSVIAQVINILYNIVIESISATSKRGALTGE